MWKIEDGRSLRGWLSRYNTFAHTLAHSQTHTYMKTHSQKNFSLANTHKEKSSIFYLEQFGSLLPTTLTFHFKQPKLKHHVKHVTRP